MLLDQQDGAGNLAGRNLVANVIADPIERGGRESRCIRRLWLGERLLRRAAEKRQRERRRDEQAPCGAVSSPALHRPTASASVGRAGAPSASAPAPRRTCPACGRSPYSSRWRRPISVRRAIPAAAAWRYR